MRSTRRTFLMLAGSSLALAGLSACTPTSGPAAGGASGGGTPAPSASLDVGLLQSTFTKGVQATGLAGAAIRVRHNGQVWESTAGVGDRGSNTPYPANGFVRIASITKSYIGTIILQMVAEKNLTLDDLLERHVPGVPNGGAIKIRHLLGMRSGIFDFTADEKFLADFTADPTMAWSVEDTIEVIQRNEPLFPPTAKVEYCDSNYALLGAIAERLDNAPLDQIIATRVTSKLGLKDTYYPTDATLRTPHAMPYVPTMKADGSIDPAGPATVVTDVNPDVSGGAGAMISTLADLAAWGDELVNGTLLPPDLQAERLKVQRFEGVPMNLGYGLGIMNFNEYLGHNGAIFGFSSVVLTRPQTGTQIAIVGNESTLSSTPTMTIAVGMIRAIDPSQAG